MTLSWFISISFLNPTQQSRHCKAAGPSHPFCLCIRGGTLSVYFYFSLQRVIVSFHVRIMSRRWCSGALLGIRGGTLSVYCFLSLQRAIVSFHVRLISRYW